MSTTSVIVVGAGLSGLACAFDLARAGADVTTLEATDRAGGVVGTIELDGYRFETGPNTVQGSSTEFRRLCGDLGIADRLVVSRPDAKARYLWIDGRLVALPSSVAGFLTTPILSLSAKLRVASELLRRFQAPLNGGEPTLRAFFDERLGSEAATRLAGAFVRGVYAAELDELGARSAFPRMWRACTERGGLLRGLVRGRTPDSEPLPGPSCKPTDLLSFRHGLRELVEALAHTRDVNVMLGEGVERLTRDADGWNVRTSGGFALHARHVVLACPAPAAAELVASAGIDGELVLGGITHADVTLVHLGLRTSDFPRFPTGFGYLVPPDADRTASPRVLGTIFASNLFEDRAPRDGIAITSFYRTEDVRAWSSLEHEAAADLARAVGVTRIPTPVVSRVVRWRGVIPRYAPGHRARIDALAVELASNAPGLHLAGCYAGGVSVEQVIAHGRATARAILGGSEGTVETLEPASKSATGSSSAPKDDFTHDARAAVEVGFA